MACFRENEIYLDKEDFSFVFDLVEKYDPLTYMPIPDSVAENPEYADFIQLLQKDTKGPDGEAFTISEREEESEEEDIIGSSALQRLRNFHETMVDMHELEEWVEQHAHVKKRLEDNHLPLCSCRICNDFTTLWFDMSNIVNAYQKKEAFRRFLHAYEASEKDMESLAKLFLKNYPLVKSLHIPDSIDDNTKGIVVYYNAYSTSERLRFVFADETWASIYQELPWFSGMMNAMYFYILDRFNAENKSFYLRYDFEKICEFFGDKLVDEVSFFFEINYEIATRFPDSLTPEGKFLY
jgi:hypothetical protein